MLSKTASILRPHVRRLSAQHMRAFLGTSPSPAAPVPPALEEEARAPDVPTMLFEGSQAFQIRIMLGTATLNMGWWSYFMVDYFLYKDIVTEGGTSLVTSPWFGAAGAVGTIAILFVTRMYSRNAVYKIWESADMQRLGFQMHTMLGNPGRKIEVPVGNARFSNLKVSSFTKEMVVLKIDGVANNCVVDKDGEFHDPEKLRELLQAEKQQLTDSKEHRINWKKAASRVRTSGRR